MPWQQLRISRRRPCDTLYSGEEENTKRRLGCVSRRVFYYDEEMSAGIPADISSS